jgi:hypothetical protein
MANNIGTLIIAPVRPQADNDAYPSAFANEIKGGHHQVTSLTERDLITTDRRVLGMLCSVVTISSSNTYQLIGGIDNGNWSEFNVSNTADFSSIYSDINTISSNFDDRITTLEGNELSSGFGVNITDHKINLSIDNLTIDADIVSNEVNLQSVNPLIDMTQSPTMIYSGGNISYSAPMSAGEYATLDQTDYSYTWEPGTTVSLSFRAEYVNETVNIIISKDDINTVNANNGVFVTASRKMYNLSTVVGTIYYYKEEGGGGSTALTGLTASVVASIQIDKYGIVRLLKNGVITHTSSLTNATSRQYIYIQTTGGSDRRLYDLTWSKLSTSNLRIATAYKTLIDNSVQTTGSTITGVTDITNSTLAISNTTGALKVLGGISSQDSIHAPNIKASSSMTISGYNVATVNNLSDYTTLTVTEAISSNLHLQINDLTSDILAISSNLLIQEVTNPNDNRLVTFNSSNSLNGEELLTFGENDYLDFVGPVLTISGSVNQGFNVVISGSNLYAHAQGYSEVPNRLIASGIGSHAEGYVREFYNPEDLGENSPAIIIASGKGSHAEGYSNWGSIIASGDGSHAEGDGCQAIGLGSHAEGYYTKAIGEGSHAEGYNTEALETQSHAEGESTKAIGYSSHAEGYETKAYVWAHAEGANTTAHEGSHTEGYLTTALYWGHAEGESTNAMGNSSHAEGLSGVASGDYSHVEGIETIASGLGSHAEGYQTIASGEYSHADGYKSRANHDHTYAWSDGTEFSSSQEKSFNIFTTNGVNISGAPVTVNGVPLIDTSEVLAISSNLYNQIQNVTVDLSDYITSTEVEAISSNLYNKINNLDFTDVPDIIHQVTVSNSINTLDTFENTLTRGCEWLVTVENGSNLRISKILAVWDTTGNISFYETSTEDIGDTTPISFTVENVNGEISLIANITSGIWIIRYNKIKSAVVSTDIIAVSGSILSIINDVSASLYNQIQNVTVDLSDYITTSDLYSISGQPYGLATLGADGKVPIEQLSIQDPFSSGNKESVIDAVESTWGLTSVIVTTDPANYSYSNGVFQGGVCYMTVSNLKRKYYYILANTSTISFNIDTMGSLGASLGQYDGWYVHAVENPYYFFSPPGGIASLGWQGGDQVKILPYNPLDLKTINGIGTPLGIATLDDDGLVAQRTNGYVIKRRCGPSRTMLFTVPFLQGNASFSTGFFTLSHSDTTLGSFSMYQWVASGHGDDGPRGKLTLLSTYGANNPRVELYCDDFYGPTSVGVLFDAWRTVSCHVHVMEGGLASSYVPTPVTGPVSVLDFSYDTIKGIATLGSDGKVLPELLPASFCYKYTATAVSNEFVLFEIPSVNRGVSSGTVTIAFANPVEFEGVWYQEDYSGVATYSWTTHTTTGSVRVGTITLVSSAGVPFDHASTLLQVNSVGKVAIKVWQLSNVDLLHVTLTVNAGGAPVLALTAPFDHATVDTAS